MKMSGKIWIILQLVTHFHFRLVAPRGTKHTPRRNRKADQAFPLESASWLRVNQGDTNPDIFICGEYTRPNLSSSMQPALSVTRVSSARCIDLWQFTLDITAYKAGGNIFFPDKINKAVRYCFHCSGRYSAANNSR